MELVFVEWEDSQGCPQGWLLFDDASSETVRIQSVGWVLRESRAAVTLVPHVGSVKGVENQGQGIMTIPKRCIIVRRTISPLASPSPGSKLKPPRT